MKKRKHLHLRRDGDCANNTRSGTYALYNSSIKKCNARSAPIAGLQQLYCNCNCSSHGLTGRVMTRFAVRITKTPKKCWMISLFSIINFRVKYHYTFSIVICIFTRLTGLPKHCKTSENIQQNSLFSKIHLPYSV